MLIVILHQPNQRIEHLHQNFSNENIEIENCEWKPYTDVSANIADANAVIIYCDKSNKEIVKSITEIRLLKNYIPIIVMDEKEDAETKNRIFELGADGYFSQPFFYRVIARYIKNLIFKKHSLNGNKWMRAFGICLDLEKRFVKRSRYMTQLRNKEFALLEFFLANRGKIITRNDILEHVWDRNSRFSSNTVDVHINRLRRKIDDPFREKLIHTVHCLGYVFEKRKRTALLDKKPKKN